MSDQPVIRTLPDGRKEATYACWECRKDTIWRRRGTTPWFCTMCGTHDVDSDQPVPVPEEPAPVPRTQPREIAWLLFAGACLAVLGAFLPWLTVTAGLVSSSQRGIDYDPTDGWICIIGGIIIGVWELIHLSKQLTPNRVTALIQAVVAVLIGEIAVTDLHALTDRANAMNIGQGGRGTVDIGIYLMVVATALLLIGAIWRFISTWPRKATSGKV
jgi:hypothetical protein